MPSFGGEAGVRPLPAEVALDPIPELLGEIERLRAVAWCGYAAGGGCSGTTKCWSNTQRVSGCKCARMDGHEVIRAVKVCSHWPLPRQKSRTPKFMGSFSRRRRELRG